MVSTGALYIVTYNMKNTHCKAKDEQKELIINQ